MNSIARDPKGYYSILGLLPGAPLHAIKRAYRARVKSVHPDRNRSLNAREEFQRITEAYAVLQDVVRRAEYDTNGVGLFGLHEDDAPAAPYCCGSCGALTAQPRYVIFHTVKSYLLWAKRGRVEGIFCRACADRAAVQASSASWALGWWSLPGLVLTPIALLRNLLGGTKPKAENTRLLIRQARAFLARGEPRIARALAEDAAGFAVGKELKERIDQLMRDTAEGADPARRMKSRWALGGSAFSAQAMPLLALPLTLAVLGYVFTRPWNEPVSARAAIAVQQAKIGEIRHVAVEDLKLRQAPADGSPVLALLDRFATVEIIGEPTDPAWVQVRTPAGVTGFTETRALYAGSGSRFKTEWCAENRGAQPSAGEVLKRRATGDHRLLVHNDGMKDGMVKLKTLSGHTLASFFVPATYHVVVGGLPEGTFRIEMATGSHFSRGCGIFVEDMKASVLPLTLTLRHVAAVDARALQRIPEVSLVPQPGEPGQPQPLDPDRFANDD